MAATHMRLTYNAVIRGDFTVSRFAHKIGRSPCAKRVTVKLSASLPRYVTNPNFQLLKPLLLAHMLQFAAFKCGTKLSTSLARVMLAANKE